MTIHQNRVFFRLLSFGDIDGRFVKRRIDALWCNEQESNAWVWLRGAGWRKLDDRNRDACTNLLAIAVDWHFKMELACY
jgi:hypothetical protein